MNIIRKSLLILALGFTSALQLVFKNMIFIVILINPLISRAISSQCQEFLKELPSDYKYGWLQVPENWNGANLNKLQIKLFYYTNYKPGQIPIMFFNGGPLGEDHRSYKRFSAKNTENKLGFIYMDQRGTGCSSPIPAATTEQGLRRASLYGTEMNVRDAEAIRKKILGHKTPWRIFGQSHGGSIVNRYIMMFPENILSAYSFAPSLFVDSADFYHRRIDIQNQIMKKVFETFPSAEKAFLKARSIIKDSDCIKTSTGEAVCGSVLLDGYFLYLADPSDWVEFNKDIQTILTEDGRINIDAIKKHNEYTFDFFFSKNYPVIQAIMRQEITTANGYDKRLDCSLGLERLKADGTDIEKLYVSECPVVNVAYNDKLLSLFKNAFPKIKIRSTITHDKILAGLAKNPKLQYFLYTGGLDGLTTPERYFEIAARSSQITHKHYPDKGHFYYYDSEEFWSDLFRVENN